MSARVQWTGLDELRAVLKRLPADLRDEGTVIATTHVEGARDEIIAAYRAHTVTGSLAAHVTLGRGAAVGAFGVNVILKSNAPHAWLFEFGSETRQYITTRGVKHLTGKMPKANIFVPTVRRWRAAMYTALNDLLRRKGLKVAA